jgi:stage II sporulation protein M
MELEGLWVMGKLFKINLQHIKKYPSLYLVVFVVFLGGGVMGHFVLDGLLIDQKHALQNYMQGFMKIFILEKVDNIEVFKVSLFREFKQGFFLWALGVGIIGAPLILLSVFFRGFALGFTFSTLVMALGKESYFLILALVLLKELFIVTAVIALCVNGIAFSTELIAALVGKKFLFDNIKIKFLRYTVFTGVQFLIVLLGVFFEAVVLPVFIKI